MKEDKLKNIVLLLLAIILIVIIVKYLKIFNFICRILTIFIPVFIGFIYAWILNPIIRKLSQKHNRNFVCIGLFLLLVLLLVLFFYLLIPLFYKEIAELADILPNFFSRIEERITNLGFKDYLDNILKFLLDGIPLFLVNFVKNLFKYVGVIGVGLILGLYISMEYENIVKKFYDIVPKKHKCVVVNLSDEVSTEVRKCVNGTLLVAFCVFIMDGLCFWFVGLDAPLLFGALCGITDLIPYVGPYIGGIVAVCVGFTESRFIGILTLIICVIVQAIENYILQPIVMSKSIKISPVLIIIGLLVFGNLFGIIGMIFATPCVAILKVFFEHLTSVLERCKE